MLSLLVVTSPVLVTIFTLQFSSSSSQKNDDSDVGWKKLPQDCGRVDSSSTQHPWIVLLEYTKVVDSKKGYGCLGAVINDRHVITAAHCIYGAPERRSLTGVLVAELTSKVCRSLGIETVCTGSVPIQQTWMHPDYHPKNWDYKNDVGLIRLAQSLSLTGDYPRAVCLPRSGEVSSVSAGEMATLPVRRFDPGPGLHIEDLQMPVVSNARCSALYQQKNYQVTETTQLCAGDGKDRDACFGDTGGALVVTRHNRSYLLGITVHMAYPCGWEGWPSVYTRVEHYMPWILRTIGE